VFTPNPTGDLVAATDEGGGVRLLLTVGPAAEDIMLFGQAPCSAGRMKHRRVCYLGLLGPATNGQCDITAPYTARFGQPSPGQKIFISTCQMKNGWKARDYVASAIVPPRPLPGQQPGNQETKVETAAATGTPDSQQAPVQASFSAIRAVYKGSTPDARGLHNLLKRGHPLSTLCTPLVHSVRVALARLGMLEMPGARVWRTNLPGSSAVNC
jgi:hypothetical protein